MKFKIFYQEGDNLVSSVVDEDFFKAQKFNKNIIKIKKLKTFREYMTLSFSSDDDVIEMFSELSLILNSNIQFADALDILIAGNNNGRITELLLTIKNVIKNGLSIDKSLKKYENYIGILPILFLDIGLKNGTLKQSIDSLVMILTINRTSKKSFQDALFYPIVLFITLFLSVGFIFSFVLPRFEYLFMQLGSDIPFATQSLLFTKELISQYWIYVIGLIFGLILLLKLFYQKYKFLFDKVIVFYIPFISKLYRQFIFYRLFLTLNILLQSNYKFQIALENSKKIVNNEYLLLSLDTILNNIKNGVSIEDAFNKTNLFEDLVIRLLNISSKTNDYIETIGQITNLYKSRYDTSLKSFSKFIGPVFLFLAFLLILWLVLGIMLPTLSLGTLLK